MSKAFSMRRAISGERAASAFRSSESAVRRYSQNLGRLHQVQAQFLDDLRADEVARMR